MFHQIQHGIHLALVGKDLAMVGLALFGFDLFVGYLTSSFVHR